MKKVDYDKMYDKSTGSTETHLATDTIMKEPYTERMGGYREGFASASGVRGETAETDGRIGSPERKDRARRTGAVGTSIDDENAGLADN